MRLRVLFLALALTLTQTPAVEANKQTKSTSAPAIGPAGGYVYRYVANKQQRKDANNKWQSKDSRKENSFDPIRVAAYKSIYSLQTDPQAANIKFEFQVRPGYPKAIEQIIRLQLTKIASRFSPILSKPETVKVIMVTEKDKNWTKTDLTEIIPENDYIGALEILDWYNTKDRFRTRGGTGGGVAGYLPNKGYAYYLSHTSTFATTETYWPEVPPHEFTHVMQGLLAGGFQSQFGEGDPQAKWHGHLIEGSANTLGMALGFETLGWYSDEMDRLLKRDSQNMRSWRKMNTQEDAVAFIKAIESRNSQESFEFSYSAGQFVWEYFIGKYGADKFIEFLKNIPKTANFNENLKTTIGKDREAFYQEAGAYLLKNWQRLNK